MKTMNEYAISLEKLLVNENVTYLQDKSDDIFNAAYAMLINIVYDQAPSRACDITYTTIHNRMGQ